MLHRYYCNLQINISVDVVGAIEGAASCLVLVISSFTVAVHLTEVVSKSETCSVCLQIFPALCVFVISYGSKLRQSRVFFGGRKLEIIYSIKADRFEFWVALRLIEWFYKTFLLGRCMLLHF